MAYESEIEKLQRRYDEKPEQWFAALAEQYRKAGEIDVALEIVRSGIKDRPNYVSGHIVLGRCLMDGGHDEEAQAAFEQVLELDPENIIALNALGEVAERGGDHIAARRWIERLLEVDPMNEEARAALERVTTPEPVPTPDSQDTASAPEDATTEAETVTAETVADESAPGVDDEGAGVPAEVETTAAPVVADGADVPAPSDVVETVDNASVDSVDIPSIEGLELGSAVETPTSAFAEPNTLDTDRISSPAETPPEPPAVPDDAQRTPPTGDPFVIEKVSDPFGTGSDSPGAAALEGLDGEDAAAEALWASLGEEPDLETVPEPSPRTEEALADAQPELTTDAPRDGSDDLPPAAVEPEEPQDLAPTGAGRPEPSEPQPEPATKTPDPMAVTEPMPALALDALSVAELAEAKVRDSTPPPAPSPEPPPLEPSVPSPPQPPTPPAGTAAPVDVAKEGPPAPPRETVAAPEPVAQSGGERDGEGLDTETMAEVYARQGLFDEAIAVYRRLQESRPDDAQLASKLAELESRAQTAGNAKSKPRIEKPISFAARDTGGISVREFFERLLTERPGVEANAATPSVAESGAAPADRDSTLDTAFGGDPTGGGDSAHPAGDEVSLASVFGDEADLPGVIEGGPRDEVSETEQAASDHGDSSGLSFDQFFPGEKPAPTSEAETDSESGDDEDFKAWLQSLKS